MPKYSLLLLLAILAPIFILQLGQKGATADTGDFFKFHWYAAARGRDFDGDGDLDWCDTRGPSGYHGWDSAIDEVDRQGSASCWSGEGYPVDMAILAYMETSRPVVDAQAAWIKQTDGVFIDGCDYIYLDAYGAVDVRYRGTERLIHSRDNFSGTVWYSIIAQKNGWRTNWWHVGHMLNDYNCRPNGQVGWTDYHVHQGHITSCTAHVLGVTGYYSEKWAHPIRGVWWTEGYC